MYQHADRQPECSSPVIILSYEYSGAPLVQQAVAVGTDLVTTARTGILPQCEIAAKAWGNIDGRPASGMSQLARTSIGGLVSMQLAAICAQRGGTRWCELAIA